MAFIDWLRKQHEESARNQALFEGRPRVAASQVWGGYQDRPGGQRLMVRQPSPTSVTLTEKDDGSSTKVTKWEPDKQLKATALPSEPVMSPGRELPPGRVNPAGSLDLRLDPSRWGGQRGLIENRVSPGMMWKDPTWAGVPQARAAPQPRRVQPQHIPAMRGDIGATQSVGVPVLQRPRGMADVSNQRAMYHALRRPNPQVASIANVGMPQAGEIARQQAAIPRQQMPPPRFVPPVDPSQFPTVQNRNTGTYDAGDPRVQMGGGFDWTGRALRENVGEDLRNVWNPIGDRVKKMLEDIRRRREGQTMAPFDRGWY